jgi:hypothetical protein
MQGDIVTTSKARPDLLAAANPRRPTQDKRILAQLEHGARPQANVVHAAGWTIDGWTIGLVALLLLMCSAAWLMHDQRITPATFRHDATPSMRSAKAAVSTPQVADSAIAAEEPVEQAAAIVNLTSLATGTTLPTTADASPTPTAMTAATANAASPPPRTAATQRKPITPTARPASSPATTTAPAAPAGDSDVVLLTALVAHANQPGSVTPERSRDIVERQQGNTTVQLLTRCKQLGLIEGMLCRSRICSGRWEADAACRAPAH